MSAEIKITLIRSPIGRPASQRAILHGLGLNKVNKSVVLTNTPEIKGMVKKVSHLLKVEE
jgi:large subunit ribosomal protein L30